LNVLVQLAELVEEERAAVGDFEEALVVAIGPGECAFAMAEELALDQRRRQRAAIDRHERHVDTLAELVDRTGDHVLAGAGLALDEDRRIRRRDGGDETLHGLHRPRFANQAIRSLDGLHASLQGNVLVLELSPFDDLEKDCFDLDQLARLFDVVERAQPHGFYSRFLTGIAGHHDRFGVG
jgi:hypothetical protein